MVLLEGLIVSGLQLNVVMGFVVLLKEKNVRIVLRTVSLKKLIVGQEEYVQVSMIGGVLI